MFEWIYPLCLHDEDQFFLFLRKELEVDHLIYLEQR